MSAAAVGAYIRVLRESRGLGVKDIVESIRQAKQTIDESQLWRIERGKAEVRWPLLMAIVEAVQGDARHIQALNHEESTAEDGERLALAWLNADQRSIISQIVDENEAEVADILEDLKRDPSRLGRWLGYGRRLSEERGRYDAD